MKQKIFDAYNYLIESNDVERLKIKESLLRYCELDTLAMVMVIQAWDQIKT